MQLDDYPMQIYYFMWLDDYLTRLDDCMMRLVDYPMRLDYLTRLNDEMMQLDDYPMQLLFDGDDDYLTRLDDCMTRLDDSCDTDILNSVLLPTTDLVQNKQRHYEIASVRLPVCTVATVDEAPCKYDAIPVCCIPLRTILKCVSQM
jgi:hypothetical protein